MQAGQGRHLGSLPDELARAMLDNLGQDVDLSDEIEGSVDL